jgi:hypothetical protein
MQRPVSLTAAFGRQIVQSVTYNAAGQPTLFCPWDAAGLKRATAADQAELDSLLGAEAAGDEEEVRSE